LAADAAASQDVSVIIRRGATANQMAMSMVAFLVFEPAQTGHDQTPATG
jgi:hypothetical protein